MFGNHIQRQIIRGVEWLCKGEKLSLLKWFRKRKTELENKSHSGESKRLEVVWDVIPPIETRAAIEHWW